MLKSFTESYIGATVLGIPVLGKEESGIMVLGTTGLGK